MVHLDFVSIHSQIFKILTHFEISEVSRLFMEMTQMFLMISWIPLNLYGLYLSKWLYNYVNF